MAKKDYDKKDGYLGFFFFYWEFPFYSLHL